MSPDLKGFNFGKLVEDIQNEITMISATIKEKTLNRFVRPILISVVMVFASHHFVYNAPVSKMKGLQKKIDAAKATSEYADQYKQLKDALTISYAKLPTDKDQDHWLSDTLIANLKAEGLISDSIQPPESQLNSGFNVQRVSIAMTIKFSETYALLRRLERVNPVLHIMGMDLSKIQNRLEMNNVTLNIATMVPTKKL
jgi:hypothetical protein